MLTQGYTLLLIAALQAGPAEGPKGPKPGKPPQQQQQQPPSYPSPSANSADDYSPPAQASRMRVLSAEEKRCGIRNRCVLDSREPCPSCW